VIILVGGPTASGKSQCALDLAEHYDGVIINADSQQLYADLPTLSAMPSEKEFAQYPHRLYGIYAPEERPSAGQWAEQAAKEIKLALKAQKTPIVVGGSGLYLKTLCQGIAATPSIPPPIRHAGETIIKTSGLKALYDDLIQKDPLMGRKLHPNDRQRILRAWEVITETGVSLMNWQRTHKRFFKPDEMSGFALCPEKESLHDRAFQRLEAMFQGKGLEEVTILIQKKVPETAPIMSTLGAKEVRAYLNNEMSYQAALDQAFLKTKHYIKRQRTWFRHQYPFPQYPNVYTQDILSYLINLLQNRKTPVQ